jgi:PAS domain-containing protein
VTFSQEQQRDVPVLRPTSFFRGPMAKNQIRSNWAEFSQLSALDLLRKDRRPTFVLDLTNESRSVEPDLQPIFVNPSLFTTSQLLKFIRGDRVVGRDDHKAIYGDFVHWAREAEPLDNEHHRDFAYGRTNWTSLTLENRWRIISTDQQISFPGGIHEHSTSNSSSLFELPLHTRNGSTDNISINSNNITGKSFFVSPTQEKTLEEAMFSSPSGSSESLATQKRLAKSNADLLAKIAAFDTVGIYVTDIEGNIQFCNNCWYEITQHPRHLTNAMGWMDCFEDDEIPKVLEIWKDIVVNQKACKFEARMKRRWIPPAEHGSAPVNFPTWISAYSYPDVSQEGKTIGCSGVLTDISERKWIETLKEQQLVDAVERAKLQEQLAARALEVKISEMRFRRLAEMLPIGIFSKFALLNILCFC